MSTEPEPSLQLSQLLSILRRRKGLILGCGALGAVLGISLGWFIPEKYTAKAQIIVEPSTAATAPLVGGGALVSDSEIETHVTMVASRDHLQRALDSLKVDIGAKLVTAKGIAVAVDDIERGHKSFQERKSRVVAVTYTASRPEQAAAIANRIASLYVEHQSERNKLERRGAPVEQQLAVLHHQLSLARSEQQSLNARYERLNQLRRSDGFGETLLDAIDSPVIAELTRSAAERARARDELAARLGAENLNVQQATRGILQLQDRLKAEVDRSVDQAEAEAVTGATRVRTLEARMQLLQEARSEARNDVTRVQAASAGDSAMSYAALLQSQRQTPATPDSATVVRLGTLADAPKYPSSVNPFLFVLPATIAFMIGGSLLGTVLERLDQTTRSDKDLASATGVACLGFVPVHGDAFNPVALGADGEPPAASAAALRALALGFVRTEEAAPAREVVQVTSSLRGEGRTTITLCLATAAAMVGRSVVVVDLDFHAAEPIGILPGAPFDSVPLPCNAADSLNYVAGPALKAHIEKLRQHYDCLIIDSGALSTDAEARLIARLADRVVVVARWGGTSLPALQAALAMLPSSEGATPRVETLLNQVDLERHAEYGFGDAIDGLARLEGQRRSSLWRRLMPDR